MQMMRRREPLQVRYTSLPFLNIGDAVDAGDPLWRVVINAGRPARVRPLVWFALMKGVEVDAVRSVHSSSPRNEQK